MLILGGIVRLYLLYLCGKTQAWYPILHCTRPFHCFSDHMFTDSAYFPPNFRSFAAGLALLVSLILRWSCLAGGNQLIDLTLQIINCFQPCCCCRWSAQCPCSCPVHRRGWRWPSAGRQTPRDLGWAASARSSSWLWKKRESSSPAHQVCWSMGIILARAKI